MNTNLHENLGILALARNLSLAFYKLLKFLFFFDILINICYEVSLDDCF